MEELEDNTKVTKKPLRTHFIAAFWISLVVAFGLMITGFFMPPKGKIDGSVLTGTGLIFMWPTLACGAKAIEEGKTAKFITSHTTLSVGDHKEEHK